MAGNLCRRQAGWSTKQWVEPSDLRVFLQRNGHFLSHRFSPRKPRSFTRHLKFSKRERGISSTWPPDWPIDRWYEVIHISGPRNIEPDPSADWSWRTYSLVVSNHHRWFKHKSHDWIPVAVFFSVDSPNLFVGFDPGQASRPEATVNHAVWGGSSSHQEVCGD